MSRLVGLIRSQINVHTGHKLTQTEARIGGDNVITAFFILQCAF